MALTIYDVLGTLIENSTIGGRKKAQLNEAVLSLAEEAGTPVVPVDPTAPLEITTESVPPATAGDAYTAKLASSGGVEPITWKVAGLPGGLSVSDSGVITGTPTVQAADVSLTAFATDASVPPKTAVVTLPFAVA